MMNTIFKKIKIKKKMIIKIKKIIFKMKSKQPKINKLIPINNFKKFKISKKIKQKKMIKILYWITMNNCKIN